jgi:23S rRNA (uridine2552-2'-O)-methyltransferase
VGVERAVGFFFDVGGQAIVTDHDHGVKVVRFGAVNFALCRGELYLGHASIIGAMKKTPSAPSPAAAAGKPKPSIKGKKVNKAWLHDHINDPYVKLASREGYRARAAYKLKEIDETFGLVKPGQLVVDLGCTPGAWSQYLRRRMSPQGAAVGDLNGTIIGLDLLPMEPIEGVNFILGDFREAEVLAQLEATLAGRQADVVVSDMAPNLSGIASADAARIEYLVELAIEFAQNHMKAEGALVAKVFHGGSYNEVVQRFKVAFHTVKPFKPKASRDRSSETFLVGIGLK